jgi:hypothetical protein
VTLEPHDQGTLGISYVVATDTFDTIRHVVRAVARQTIRDRVELVIVCPSEGELGLDPTEAEGIGAVRVVEFDPVVPLSPPRAAGIRAASCPLIFVGETHSFPASDCLETLLAAHRSGHYAAVTPVIENANPEKALSWAGLMLTYRHWIEPARRGEIDVVSTYNACFRREVLVDFGDRLAVMLDYGSGLDIDLRARGGRFLIEPAARLAHLNIAALNGWMPERFLSGRFAAVARARRWPRARRLLYALAAPLIPLMIAGRAVRSAQWAHHRGKMPRGTLGALVLCALATGAGEVTGYVAGGGRTPVRLAEYELHRARYL